MAMRPLRILLGFALLTLPLMPVQALLLRLSPARARTFPHWYHRQVCRLIGIRLHIDGEVASGRPVLLVSNHTSWLDIPVLSAVAPVSFVAKKEVGRWPFVSSLARLQRTVFVDRQRRTETGRTAGEIAERLAAGDTLVLFAEGTSTDGNRVLPFKTSLFAAAKPSSRKAGDPSAAQTSPESAEEKTPIDTGAERALIQTVTLCYTHLHGVPMTRADRFLTGWYGDMDMGPHAWELLAAGPLDARVVIGPPVPLADFADRKALARHSETEIRMQLIRILRALPAGAPVTPATSAPPRPSPSHATADAADPPEGV